MKKLRSFSMLFLLFVLATSCSNSDSPTAPSLSTGDYWPTAINNIWNYNDGTTQTPMKIISSNAGYFLFDNFIGNTASGGITAIAPVSIKKDNGDYYIKYGTIQIAGAYTGTMTGFEAILLKDYLAVGGTWSSNYSQTTNLNGLPSTTSNTTVNGTIMETGVSLLVSGVTYTNVIHVKYLMSTNTQGSISNSENHYWFSKNVGLIKYTNVTPTFTRTTLLTSYTLN